MSDYTETDVATARAIILENFHPPTNAQPSWHINPGEMARAVLDAIAPAIAARAKADAWDEAAEATADWMWNNPGPSGIPTDPPQNPYADEIERSQS